MVRRPVKWLVVLLCLALPAQAQEVRFPALFDVVGVASDDVLNIRERPRGTSGIIQELRHDATAIEVIELSENGDWGRVNVYDQTGWTAMRFLARQPGQDIDTVPAIEICSGTEPFWSLDLRPPAPSLRTPLADLSLEMPIISPVAGRYEPWSLIGETDHGPIYGILSRKICSDGMSDAVQGYQLDLIEVGYGSYTGCCTLSR